MAGHLPTKIAHSAGHLNNFFKCPVVCPGGVLAAGIYSHVIVGKINRPFQKRVKDWDEFGTARASGIVTRDAIQITSKQAWLKRRRLTQHLSLLNEENIPGAKLVKPIEKCSCAVLRRWLLCRGAELPENSPI